MKKENKKPVEKKCCYSLTVTRQTLTRGVVTKTYHFDRKTTDAALSLLLDFRIPFDVDYE